MIGCFFLLAGTYLCSISVLWLLARGHFRGLSGLPLLHSVSLASPYLSFGIGIAWSLVAWGLFRLHDWARWLAQIFLAIGVALELPMLLLNGMHFGPRWVIGIPEIILRVVAVGYLFTPGVLQAFTGKRFGQSSNPRV